MDVKYNYHSRVWKYSNEEYVFHGTYLRLPFVTAGTIINLWFYQIILWFVCFCIECRLLASPHMAPQTQT